METQLLFTQVPNTEVDLVRNFIEEIMIVHFRRLEFCTKLYPSTSAYRGHKNMIPVAL